MTAERDDRTDEARRPEDRPANRRADAPAGDVPNELDAERTFPDAEPTSLRAQRPLTDDDGDDIRQYTGEPVPTESGEVLPQQMASGSPDNVGGGEWPTDPPRGADPDWRRSTDVSASTGRRRDERPSPEQARELEGRADRIIGEGRLPPAQERDVRQALGQLRADRTNGEELTPAVASLRTALGRAGHPEAR